MTPIHPPAIQPAIPPAIPPAIQPTSILTPQSSQSSGDATCSAALLNTLYRAYYIVQSGRRGANAKNR